MEQLTKYFEKLIDKKLMGLASEIIQWPLTGIKLVEKGRYGELGLSLAIPYWYFGGRFPMPGMDVREFAEIYLGYGVSYVAVCNFYAAGPATELSARGTQS